MRSITTFDIQYAHRFYGFKGEAQYLHGHTGVLTLEVEDSVEPGVNMVYPFQRGPSLGEKLCSKVKDFWIFISEQNLQLTQ